MRVALLTTPGTVGLVERPIPQPGPGEVLVRVEAVGVCGSDTHYYDHGRIGRFVVEQPLVLGHEAGGTVTEVGAGVPAGQVAAALTAGRRDPASIKAVVRPQT